MRTAVEREWTTFVFTPDTKHLAPEWTCEFSKLHLIMAIAQEMSLIFRCVTFNRSINSVIPVEGIIISVCGEQQVSCHPYHHHFEVYGILQCINSCQLNKQILALKTSVIRLDAFCQCSLEICFMCCNALC